MPDTTASRSIVVDLWPKRPDEKVEVFLFADSPEFQELRRKLARWSADNAATLAEAKPALPPGFNNRLAANWRLLLAIADHAGGDWPKRARLAATRLLSRQNAEPSVGIRLLTALQEIFANRNEITSAELVQLLAADPDAEWGAFRGRAAISQRELAALLKPYDVRPVVLHPDKRSNLSRHGYRRSQFKDAFARFLPANIRTSEHQGVTANVRMFGSRSLIMVKRETGWTPTMEQRAGLEGRQVKCLIASEGHLWMQGYYDRFPGAVRQRLAASPFNICPACMDEEARRASAAAWRNKTLHRHLFHRDCAD